MSTPRLPCWPIAAAMLLAAGSAHAAPAPELADLVNAYRAAPGPCHGRAALAAAALALEAQLSRVQLEAGSMLLAVLQKAGFDAEQADVLQVSGPADAYAAAQALRATYCSTLLSPDYTAIGAQRAGDTWSVVLVRVLPDLALDLPGQDTAARQVLDATNAARAQPRLCGRQRFGAAPPLAWSAALAQAALAHSQDMAAQRYFSHEGRDGAQPVTRARRAGYPGRRIGENIAAGQRSAEEAVAGWISSPGHCANLMDPGFTDMGGAYAVRPPPRQSAYWTQVFGTR